MPDNSSLLCNSFDERRVPFFRTRKTPIRRRSAIAVKSSEWTPGWVSGSSCWVWLLEHYSTEIANLGEIRRVKAERRERDAGIGFSTLVLNAAMPKYVKFGNGGVVCTK